MRLAKPRYRLHVIVLAYDRSRAEGKTYRMAQKWRADRSRAALTHLSAVFWAHSERSACMTSMRAARAAGKADATTAAVSSTNAERTTSRAPGIFTSRK